MTTVAERATDADSVTAPDSGQGIRLVEPLPGFPDDHDFTLTAIDPRGMLHSLRSVREPGLRFVLASASVFFPDFRPDLVPAVEPVLGGSDVDALLVLTIGSGLADATANLRAPVALCRSTGRAVQVILDDEALPMRQPLVAS